MYATTTPTQLFIMSRVDTIEEQLRIIIKASYNEGLESVLTPDEQVIYDAFIQMSKCSEALLSDEDLATLMIANDQLMEKYGHGDSGKTMK